ncbi:MAG TPA: RHS repeat-associated core domain-containing protein [Gammaproteobacteria bacterium]
MSAWARLIRGVSIWSDCAQLWRGHSRSRAEQSGRVFKCSDPLIRCALRARSYSARSIVRSSIQLGLPLFLLTSPALIYAAGSFSTLAGYYSAIEIKGYASLADAAIASCEITNTLSPPAGFQCEPSFSLHPNWVNFHFPENIGAGANITGYYTNATYWTNHPTYGTYPYYPISYNADVPPKIKDLGSYGGGNCVGNPIGPASGNKRHQESDFSIGRALVFGRYYQSSSYVPTASLGKQWRNNFDRKIATFANRFAYIYRADGKGYTYELINSIWIPDPDIIDKLEHLTDPNGTPIGWRYTTSDGEVELYNATGTLQSITDINGNTQTLTYDTQNRLDRVDTNTGEYLIFGYDTNNRIATLTDHTSRQWHYRYDALGNLEYVDNPDGTSKRHHYEDSRFPHALTGITDERGIRYATYGYDAEGRANLSTHAGNAQRVDIVYNTDGTRTVTNSRGQASTYDTAVQLGVALVTDITGPGCSTCGTGNTSYNYDPANNNLLSKTENGVTTQYGDYDSKGQYGYKIEAVGTPQQRRTDYTYDARFYHKITTITEPSVAPGQNKVTTYTYDDWGNRLTETVNGFKPDGTPVTRTTTRQYNGPLHQLSQIDGPRTDVADLTTYVYYPDDANQGANRARLLRVTDAHGVAIRDAIQYTGTGKVLSESRSNGLTLSYTYYPGNDRLQTLTESAGSVSRVTRWTYLATGEVETITQADGTADATTLSFGYDDARRLTRVTDGLGNYIAYQLDTEGNREAERIHDSAGTLKKQLTQTFDLYNRLDTTAQANESADPDYAPDGTLDTATDGKGVVTDYSYDALKRLTQAVQDHSGSDPATANAGTGYDYDTAGRLTRVTDPVNGNTLYVYDDLGNLLSQTSPDTGTTTYSYDSAGNPLTRTDAKGQVFSYTYDALNRLTAIDGPGTDSDVNYTYDSCGSGRLCRVSSSAAVVDQRYDALGDLAGLPGIAYTHDNAGRVKTLTYPSGARVTYSYTAVGQVASVTLTVAGVTQTLADNLVHAPFGPLTRLDYGNGLSLTQTFDTAYRMQSQSIPGVLALSYPQYDANGNLSTRADTLTSSNESYAYDALDRLDSASGPFGARDYGYDKNGNRTALDGTTYAYTPNSNRLDSIGSTDVLLDANGNTLNKGAWTFDYSAHNRLTAAHVDGTLAATYAYNALGQRIAKTKPDGTGRHFLYGADGTLLAETDVDGNLFNEYIYLDGQPLAVYQPDDDNDGLSNAEEDPLGSNPANADSDGDGLRNLDEWYVAGTDARVADSDGDGVLDGAEVSAGTDPTNPAIYPGDGDVNQDGEVNVGDLVLVMQMVTGRRVPTPEQLTHADAYTDGEIDVRDMLILQRRILQLSLREWLDGHPDAQTMLAGIERMRQAVSTAFAQIDLVDAAQAAVANGKLYYIHTDHLGTPKALTDEAGMKVWSATHDPFGLASVNDDPDGNGQKVAFNLRFPGQYYDAETGLHYNYFRTYDPGTGRYLESDPIGLDGGLNMYAYASSNPIMRVDPAGLVDWEGTFGGIAVINRVGAGFFRFDLTSECKCGRRIRIKGYASTVAVGLGFKYTGSGSAASFFDTNSCPDASAANGVAIMTAASLVPGGGFSISKSQLGDLNSSPPRTSGPVYGLDISIGAYVGASVVTDFEILECCESQ